MGMGPFGESGSGATSRREAGIGAAWLALVLALVALSLPVPGHGQLISPGPLTDPHASLEGLRNCTSCHQLGRKGAADDKCRSCHTTIDSRIKADRGYHAGLKNKACAECHKEHQGRGFALVRLDSASFDHAATGYRLDGGHEGAGCGECHQADRIRAADVLAWGRKHGVLGRTMLGLETRCQVCHTEDNPHGRQFSARDCETCHTTAEWERAGRFDHDKTDYRLTGEHRTASCDGCHPTEGTGDQAVVKYDGVRVGNCSTCHQDNHQGAMGADCTVCHDPRGWSSVNKSNAAKRFDHGRTAFPLAGGHATAECAACHARRRRANDPVHIRLVPGTERASFPKPRSGSCAECHVTAHPGELADRTDAGSCESCHDVHRWTPASFGIERHNAETAFPLTGAHLTTFCSACHGPAEAGPANAKMRFTIAAQDCASCHRGVDPHEGRFGDRPCETCHITESFLSTRFDHTGTEPGTCITCHATDDPHAGQFDGASCDRCHETNSFATPTFDHGRARFVLDGRHVNVACSGCHLAEPGAEGVAIVRYRPLPMECTACHGSAS